MVTPSSLHTYVFERLQAAFGLPHRTLGVDRHWRLLTGGSSINLLADGAPEGPVVWVFNPNDHERGIQSTPVRSEEDIEHLITTIQERVLKAGRKTFGRGLRL